MKFYAILIAGIIASASAEPKPEPEPKPLEIQWRANYGEYGVQGALPIQYNVPVYRYGYPEVPYRVSYPGVSYPGIQYPGVQYPGIQYPGVSYPGVSYPGVTYPSMPYPMRVGVKGVGNIVTSYDPDYFSSTRGFYPDN